MSSSFFNRRRWPFDVSLKPTSKSPKYRTRCRWQSPCRESWGRCPVYILKSSRPEFEPPTSVKKHRVRRLFDFSSTSKRSNRAKIDKKHQQQIQKSHEDTKKRETDNSKIPIRSRHNPVKKFRVNLRYAGIKSFLLANWTHVMILNESEGLIYSIAYIYAEYIFREFTIMV